jgi:glycosyltransferase involved in cell wall biosynthesis
MACGASAVMTSRACGPEMVENGVSGLLADPDKPEEMAYAICRLLKNNSLRRELGINARKRAVAMFDVDSLSEKNLQFYREVIDGFKN